MKGPTNTAMKYDAFISYKHEKLDMEVAKKLHSALETYHIPKAVQKKTGMKKIERVFRDQTTIFFRLLKSPDTCLLYAQQQLRTPTGSTRKSRLSSAFTEEKTSWR